MAELKPFEVIMKIDFAGSNGIEIVAHAEKVAELVRCGDCKWFQCNMNYDGTLPNGVPKYECRHWCGECDPTDFCSYAERRKKWTI